MRYIKAAMIAALAATLTCAAAAQTAKTTTAAEPGDLGWPREYTENGARLILYQPQVDSWEEQGRLQGRLAAAVQPAGAQEPVFGALRIEADTKLNKEAREVDIFNLRIADARFPSADEGVAVNIEALARSMALTGPITVTLDRLMAYLETGQMNVREVKVSLEPPPVFLSQEPAVLLMIDGKPVLGEIKDTGLEYVVNTNWDLFLHKASSRYYLLNREYWLTSEKVDGPWLPAGELPEEFGKLPDEPNWEEARKQLDVKRVDPEDVPRIFVSYRPAELILFDGEPKFAPIPGTQLMEIENTDSDVFFHQGDRYYYFLTSGRWFRTASPQGPWEAATLKLPEDFARIPQDHRRADVLASVKGTQEADEAVLLASIPHTATIDRSKAKADVSYAGDPEFQPIDGTSLSYAANTPQDVFLVSGKYYLCEQGVWFISDNAAGPWSLADTVPDEIYAIPPESPKHHLTYVQVYNSTPSTVTCGHTSGYTGVYLSLGLAFWGTGWHYPPYYWYGPYRYPYYFPYPYYTYGVRAGYNPHTGAYYRGASVYGPWGGYGGGAAYNPRTGAYSRGGAVWGPYGAARGGASYNPSTGTWRRGGAAVDYWNDSYAAGYRGGNQYARWGEAVVGQGDDWAYGRGYRDSRGAVGSIETSEGGRAVFAGNENRRGIVGRDEDNNVYAGKDGNVYKREDDGDWYKRDGDDWDRIDSDQVERFKSEKREGVESGTGALRSQAETAGRNLSGEQRQALQERTTGSENLQQRGTDSQSRRGRVADSQARVQPGQVRSEARPQPGQTRSPGASSRTARTGSASSQRNAVGGLERDASARRQGQQRTQQYRSLQRSSSSRTRGYSGGRGAYRGRGGGRRR